jgi:hypothetical protein
MSNFVTLQIWDEYDDIVRTNEEIFGTSNVSCIGL